MLTRAGLSVATCAATSREAKKPFFQIVLAIADKPKPGASPTSRTPRPRGERAS
jgi:ArsR family transcriptional regulator